MGRAPKAAGESDRDERSDGPFVEALTVAMVVAPGVYARNRMFQFFARPRVKTAKRRAATLRGIIPQLRRATTLAVESEPSGAFVLRYSIAALRLSRVVELSATELAALRLLAARADVRALPPEPSDRELVESVLARLVDGAPGSKGEDGPSSSEVVRRVRESVAPRAE